MYASYKQTVDGAGSSMLVLVTGATGYIACELITQLQNAGYRVRGTVRSLKNEDKLAPLRALCPNAKYPLELVEADLSNEGPWGDAVKDCTHVLHTASPFVMENPENEDDVLKPAEEGTLIVLRACAATPSVKRVVVTSSMVAVAGAMRFPEQRNLSEKDWPDMEHPDVKSSTYVRSKILAEKAAWDFHKTLPEGKRFELATINPSFVMGPVLCGGAPTSAQFAMGMMYNMIPQNGGICYCDVRDVAAAHVAAMTVPEAAGNRHGIYSESLWNKDVQKILADEFNSKGFDVKQTFEEIKDSYMFTMDNSRMRNVLGITPTPAKKSLIDMINHMIANGALKPQ